MKNLKKLSYLLAGIAVLLLVVAISIGLAIGFSNAAAIYCLVIAFAASIAGALLSVIWKSAGKK